MFRQCKCGTKGGSVSPLRSSGIVPWVCKKCRDKPGIKRMTIRATIVSYREKAHGVKLYLKK